MGKGVSIDHDLKYDFINYMADRSHIEYVNFLTAELRGKESLTELDIFHEVADAMWASNEDVEDIEKLRPRDWNQEKEVSRINIKRIIRAVYEIDEQSGDIFDVYYKSIGLSGDRKFREPPIERQYKVRRDLLNHINSLKEEDKASKIERELEIEVEKRIANIEKNKKIYITLHKKTYNLEEKGKNDFALCMVSLALFYYSEAKKEELDYRERCKEEQKRRALEKKETEEKYFPFPVPDSIRWYRSMGTDTYRSSDMENWERGIKDVINAFDYSNVDIEIKNYFKEMLYEGMKSYNIFTGNMKEVVTRGLDEYPEKRKERIREEIILEKDAEKKLKDRKLAIERLPKRIDNIINNYKG